MASTAAQQGRTWFEPGGRFSPEALDANRSGRLTDVQRRELGAVERNWRKNELVGAGGLVVVAALLLSSAGPATNAWARPIVAAGCVVLAVLLVIHSLPGADRLSRDLATGGVQTIEGAMEKHSYSGENSRSFPTYYVDIKDRHFEIPRSLYEAIPAAGWARVYFLSSSHQVVNLERLEAPPLPADMTHPTMESLGGALRTLAHARGQEHHELMAELDQMGQQMGQQMKALRTDGAVPPAASARDARPLAEAIVGTWQGGPFSVTFAGDGTMEMATLGRTQHGHWSVDASGRLHADMWGREQAGDAWVAGDTLTVSVNGEGMSLKRASAG